jgi:hypothetical protein
MSTVGRWPVPGQRRRPGGCTTSSSKQEKCLVQPTSRLGRESRNGEEVELRRDIGLVLGELSGWSGRQEAWVTTPERECVCIQAVAGGVKKTAIQGEGDGTLTNAPRRTAGGLKRKKTKHVDKGGRSTGPGRDGSLGGSPSPSSKQDRLAAARFAFWIRIREGEEVELQQNIYVAEAKDEIPHRASRAEGVDSGGFLAAMQSLSPHTY